MALRRQGEWIRLRTHRGFVRALVLCVVPPGAAFYPAVRELAGVNVPPEEWRARDVEGFERYAVLVDGTVLGRRADVIDRDIRRQRARRKRARAAGTEQRA